MKLVPGDFRRKCWRAVSVTLISGIVIGSSGVLLQKIQLLFVSLAAIYIFALLHKEENFGEEPTSALLWLVTVITYLISGLWAMSWHRVLCQLLESVPRFRSSCSQGDINATWVIAVGMFSVWFISQLLIALFGRHQYSMK